MIGCVCERVTGSDADQMYACKVQADRWKVSNRGETAGCREMRGG
jgi:hypothetical protein